MISGIAGDLLAVSVLLAVGLAAAALPRRSAAERHWLLAACTACALAFPALRLAVPAEWAAPFDFRVEVGANPVPAVPVALDSNPAAVRVGALSAPAESSGAVRRAIDTPPWHWAALLPWLWLAGVVVAATRLSAALLRLRGLTRRATRLDHGPWRQAADSLGTALRLRAPVRLLVGDEPSLVATWGWRAPLILVPREALEWPDDRVRIVVAHELAHVARGDWRHQLAGEALCALYWCTPLAWLVRRRLAAEAERASDDLVLALGVDAAAYASHLVDLARSLRSHAPRWVPAPAMIRPSSLEGRVRAMLDSTNVRRPATLRRRLATAAAVLAMTLPLAGLAAAWQFHSLRGSLADPSGRVLPGAAVVLADDASGRKYEVRSDAGGRFEFVGLPPATYRLEVRPLGFRPYREEIAVSGDVERTLRLAVGTLEETITVIGDGQPEPPPDPAAQARRAERIQRAGERQQKALATCAAGPPTAAGGNILPPLKIADTRPRYPEHLRPAGVRGKVTMRATIDREGTVSEVQDIVASHPDFEAPAVEAVRDWRFTATLLNCEPIEVEMTVTVNFSAAP